MSVRQNYFAIVTASCVNTTNFIITFKSTKLSALHSYFFLFNYLKLPKLQMYFGAQFLVA